MDERPEFPGAIDLREPVVLSRAIAEWLETVRGQEAGTQIETEPEPGRD